MTVEPIAGPYSLGTLRMNDGALPLIAPADPEQCGSDRRRIALIDLTIDVKRGQGFSVTAEDDPLQMATGRLLAAAPRLRASLKAMVEAYREEVADADEPSMVREALEVLAWIDAS